MTTTMTHPVDRCSDAELRELMMRVDATGFPDDLQRLWGVERIRYRETLRRIPPADGKHASLLDLGSSRAWLPFLQVLLGYRHLVLNTSYPASGFVDNDLTVRGDAPADVRMSVFDVEREFFSHDNESFDVILCLEVLEHLAIDPMAMMAEVNRVLKPGGVFVLTTPNAVRIGSVVSVVLGENPIGWSPYNGFDGNRHNRVYTPGEVDRLFHAAGLTPTEVTTFGRKRRGFRRDLLARLVSMALLPFRHCPPSMRRDVILATGRKTSNRIERRPDWLYFDMAERRHEQPESRKAATAAVYAKV